MSLQERIQPGILKPVPLVARSLTFRIWEIDQVRTSLARLASEFCSDADVVGIGEPCVLAMGASLHGLRTFPAMSGPGCAIPSTQDALWIRLCGSDRGVVFDSARRVRQLLAAAFRVSGALDTFTYQGGRDLTRFEDGTENPKGDAALEAAIVQTGPIAGSSFVAVQQWVHDLERFEAMSDTARDHVMGRSAENNDELDDAPASAHVKRTAQESFEPAAFMLRRSMPWAGVDREGLEFVSYVASLDAFTRMMRRMAGHEDGIRDALFSFSHPVTGGFYWCPPVTNGRLDLGVLLDAISMDRQQEDRRRPLRSKSGSSGSSSGLKA
ncbi:MAG: Dyp-type peroxidase [Pseudomonadota bacterium]|nr:Dyp-type peroxidase [Pseudomonadota bacterium]